MNKSEFEKAFAEFLDIPSLPLPDRYKAEDRYSLKARYLDVSSSIRGNIKIAFKAAFAMTLAEFSGESKIFFVQKSFDKLTPIAIDFENIKGVEEIYAVLESQKNPFDFDFDLSNVPILEFADPISLENRGFHIYVVRSMGGYEVSFSYESSRYSECLIENFLDSFENILVQLSETEFISDIEPASNSQIEKLDEITEVDYNEGIVNKSITDLFRESVEAYPNSIALVYKDKRYTFKELDELTDKLGSEILKRLKGLPEEDQPVVSILISRNENMVICPLAATKAGCAYQPLDPAYPAERLNFMVSDADASLVIAEPHFADLLDEYHDEVLLTSDFANIFDSSLERIELPGCRPQDALVLLYTSGSTGMPKGVVLEHRNIATWCDWYKNDLGLQPGDNIACYASFGFDAHMSDIYPALTSGLAVHIIPEEMRLDLIALNDYFEKNNILSTLLTTAVGTQFATSINKSNLKYLITGGEKLASIDPPSDYQLINAYGPTETTITVTSKRVMDREENIPIGKNNSSAKLYVVDRYMHRLPIGAPGELIVSGPQVGRGYLNRPEKTAEVFIDDPFSNLDRPLFNRAYRTGDIVRFRDNGDIEFVGRQDFQVKINGFRIELKEIESVIREFEGIDDVTVQAFDDESGNKFIAAYVCGKSSIDKDLLSSFISEKKPSYMVPKVILQIDSIPHNVNQKVDVRALPKPEFEQSQESMGEIPLNTLEVKLHQIIAEVIGTDKFSITDELTYYGLTSINSIKLATKIFNEFKVSINALDLLEGVSLQSIENKILEALINNGFGDESTSTLQRASSSPLLFSQQGVYAECIANSDSTFYNLPYCIKMPYGTNVQTLSDACHKLCNLHPSLQGHFKLDKNDEPIFCRMSSFNLDIPVSEMSEKDFEIHKSKFVKQFDLGKGPLVRFEIVEVKDSLYLLMDAHHLVADGASFDVMLHELCKLLDGEELVGEAYTGFDLANEQEIDAENENFFDNLMAGVEQSSQLLPDIYDSNDSHSEKIVEANSDLSQIFEFAKKSGVTPAAIYLAATFLTVSRYTFEQSVAIATISNGRSDARLERSVGMFVNTLPLALEIKNEEPVSDFIERTAEHFASVLKHENHPFAAIAAKSDFKPQISYAYQVGVLEEYRTRQGILDCVDLGADRAKLPIAVQIFGDGKKSASIKVSYDTSLYSDTFAQKFADSISFVAEQLTNSKTVSEISLTDSQDWEILDSYNQKMQLDFDRGDSVVSKFREIASVNPNRVAAIYGNKTYTYDELDKLTDRLATCILQKLDIEKTAETVISAIPPRNEYVFLLPLAILKTGCAYEPLDSSYPRERLNFMVADAGARLLIGDDMLLDLVDEYKGSVLKLSELEELEASLDSVEILPNSKSNDLMCMLYTSGSTGTPKGCQIEHGNMVAFAYGSGAEGFYTSEGTVASFASFGFDVCMADTFCTLLNGGTLVVIPEDVRMNLNKLAEYFDDVGVTQVLLSTQVGVGFVQNYPVMKTLKYLVMGGEKLPALDPSKLSYTIINGYGPTENCCGVSLFPIKNWEENVPIGKPLRTIAAYVLDSVGNRVPAGAIGELCVSGPQVVRGYLNRPEKTAEAFENCPFNSFRMYHTGDIVRYRNNGDIEFVGRKDGQVKIRGNRVELKEVETVIREYPDIKDATVVDYSYESGGKYLAAFIVSEKEIDVEDLNHFIKERKPAYMVPAVTMQIDEIPLTVNKKVDRGALPKPEIKSNEFVEAKTQAEIDFCSIFSEVLGIEKIGAADDFFMLGGSSLTAMRVVVAANRIGYNIVYSDIFESTTPHALATACGDSGDIEKTTVEISSITEVGRDGYDYTTINRLLSENILESFRVGEKQKLGNVLLLGATGFLGCHVLRELLENSDSQAICLVRSKDGESGLARIKKRTGYYFGDSWYEKYQNRISIVEGDATSPLRISQENLTVINCAASVKHFSANSEIEKTNVESVKNIIDWCLSHNSRLVHISTESVFGHPSGGIPPINQVYDEHMLYAGQVYEDNEYVRSKFLAERLIYENVLDNNLNAKVLRAGNLAPRFDDGKFQINAKTNSFMNTLKGLCILKKAPYSMAFSQTEFSPIDECASAVVALSQTPQECVTFNMSNVHRLLMADVISGLNRSGFFIELVEDEEFALALEETLANPDLTDVMSPFLAYASSDNGDTEVELENISVTYTAEVLARLGVMWDVCDSDYILRFVRNNEIF